MAKSDDEQIMELKERRDQLNARIQKIQARKNAKARKARTHRLIQVGAIVETAVGGECGEAERETISHNLNSLVSVYDPKRGGNVDMRVADLLMRPAPTAGEGTDAAKPADVPSMTPVPDPVMQDMPRSFTPDPQRVGPRQEGHGRCF